jgi:hypothetical protein
MSAPFLSRLGANVPVAMSMTALAMVVGHAAVYGIVLEPNEVTPAHIFQLLMAAQIPIVAVFAAHGSLGTRGPRCGCCSCKFSPRSQRSLPCCT